MPAHAQIPNFVSTPHTLDEAAELYAEWIKTCNWPTRPSLLWWWCASECELMHEDLFDCNNDEDFAAFEADMRLRMDTYLNKYTSDAIKIAESQAWQTQT